MPTLATAPSASMLEIPISKIREVSRLTLNPDGTVNLQAINYSGIDQYLRCPEQFRRRYIEGKKEPPAVALFEGTSHHKAVEADNKSKLEKGKQLTSHQMMEIFYSTWKDELAQAEKDADELKVKIGWEDEGPDDVVKRGKILQTEYANSFSKMVDPESAEESFLRDVDVRGNKFRLMGQIDLTTKKKVVWDYKTAKRPKTDDDLNLSLQLSTYSWIKQFTEVGYITFVKAAKPYVQMTKPVTVRPGRWLWALDVIASAVDGIRRGSFPKTNPSMFPPPWWCSERHCGFWRDCRGKYES